MSMNDLRIVVLGAGGVGKSALTLRFVQDLFVTKYDPTIEDTYRKLCEVDEQPCLIEIIDTAGTEMFTAMRDLYMRNGQGFFLVYAINGYTFNEIPEIYEQILRVKDTTSVPAVLLGSKCDLIHERTILTEKGEAMAKRLNVSFFETSAMTRQNIDAAFADLIRQIRKNIASTSNHADGSSKGKKAKSSNCSVL